MGPDSFDPHENHSGKNLGKPLLSLASDFARLFARRDYQETPDFHGFAGLCCPAWHKKSLARKKKHVGFGALDRAASMGGASGRGGSEQLLGPLPYFTDLKQSASITAFPAGMRATGSWIQ